MKKILLIQASLGLIPGFAQIHAADGRENDNGSFIWAEPKISVTPLTEINDAYAKVADDESSAKSFVVSRDGKHYAFIKRTGLKTFACIVDGKAGRDFSSLAFHWMSHDFSRIILSAQDEQSKNNIVFRDSDKESVYPPYNKNLDGDGELGAFTPYRGRTPLRYWKKAAAPVWQEVFYKLSSESPALGPFTNDRSLFQFDPSGEHFVCAGISTSKSDSHLVRIWWDGKEAPGGLFPPLSENDIPSFAVQDVAVCRNGYAFAGQWNGKDGKHNRVILNGKALVTDGPHPAGKETMVLSPDGSRLGFVTNDGTQYAAVIDGLKGPVLETVGNVKFSGDSKGVMYAVGHKGQYTIIEDGIQGQMRKSPIKYYWYGPHTGDIAYIVQSGSGSVLVKKGIEGGYTEAGWDANATDSCSFGFTSDGRHVVSIASDAIPGMKVIVDGRSKEVKSATPLINPYCGSASLTSDITREASAVLQIDDKHLFLIVRDTSANAKDLFKKIEVEIVPAEGPLPVPAK